MDEDVQNAGGEAAGEQEIIAPGAADAGILTGAAEGEDAGAAKGDAGAALPDNWRELMAGGDEKALRDLSRYTSPQNVAKALLDAKARIRSGSTPIALPEDAAPEEIAAYRKALGIPEKPDGYGLAIEGANEADAELLTGFQQFMHERNVPPGGVKAAFEWYQSRIADIQAQRAEQAQQATIENLAELRKEFSPREYARNLRITNDFMMEHWGQDHDALGAIKEVMNLTLPSGVKLENYAPFMKGMFAIARANADEEALVGGDGASGGMNIEDEIKSLVDKSVAGKLSQAEDVRLNQLYEARIARETRQGRRRA